MRSNFMRNTSSREKRITYTPMFTKTFIEKSPVKTKVEDSELLKAEKIKSFWELMSYEDHYKEKKSIKARVSDILQSTASLAEEVQSLNQSIQIDENFIKQIQEVQNLQFRKRIKKNWGNHVGLAWLEFWFCFSLAERTFCTQILINQTTSALKVKIFALDSRDGITVKFGVDTGFKEILKDCEKVLTRFKENYLMKIELKTKDEIRNQEIFGIERQVNTRRTGKNVGVECFDEDCEVGKFLGVVGNEEYSVTFYENYAVYLHMVKILFRGKSYEFVSSDYKDEFERLLSLQFSALEFQKVTFFKSIEFCVFINTFINSIKSLE